MLTSAIGIWTIDLARLSLSGSNLMQPVVDGRHRRSVQRGFTLIEIMVVVMIVGIVAVGAILSLGATGQDSALERERDRLADLMAYGRERGAMLTLEYGIRCGQHGYRFVFYDNRLNQWSPESVDDTMRLRHLPAGLQLALTIEGHQIVLDDKALQITPVITTAPGGSITSLNSALSSVAGGAASVPSTSGAASTSVAASSSGGGNLGLNTTVSDNTPQILLFSNGDTNAFALTIARADVGRSVTLQSSEDGKVHVGDIVEPKP
jgi:general secretion pathway protein H